MACSKETLMLISAFADDETNPQESARAVAHLRDCAECRGRLEEWRGQLSVFEWAYTCEIPVECSVEGLERLVQKETSMTTTSKTLRLPIPKLRLPSLPRLHWRPVGMKAVAMVAATMLIGLGVYHISTRPIALEVGQLIATSDHSQAASMGRDVSIRIGPGTRLSRVDERSVRLEQGWVDIAVRGGFGLRLLTDRIEVVNQGTDFEVGSGPKMDYVIVRKGSVLVTKGDSEQLVKAGQMLVAPDAGEPFVASLPRIEDGERGVPLDHSDSRFKPSSARELDWQEGLQRLAVQFPDARRISGDGGGSGYTDATGDMEFHFHWTAMIGLNKGITKYFTEITQAMAGVAVDSDDWEIPVAIMHMSNVTTKPGLPANVYYVRLVCENGRVVWRLTGSHGSQADYPLAAEWDAIDLSESSGISSNASMSIRYSTKTIFVGNKPVANDLRVRLMDWPGEPKPSLNLRLGGLPIEETRRDEQAMLAEVAARTPDVYLSGSRELLYLDPERENRLLLIWADRAGEELEEVFAGAKKGYPGKAVLGAIVTDVPLKEPNVGAGVYLLELVLPEGSTDPHIRLVSSGAAGASHELLAGDPKDDSMGHNTRALGNPTVAVIDWGEASAQDGAFPFRFRVCGNPDGPEGDIDHGDVWAEGWIRVKQP